MTLTQEAIIRRAERNKLRDPEKQREMVRRSKAKARAAMTVEQIEARKHYDRVVNRLKKETFVTPKPETCDVCGRGGRICFDHCHVNLRFRGWLCEGCNTALGRVQDDPSILRKLADYLEQHVGG